MLGFVRSSKPHHGSRESITTAREDRESRLYVALVGIAETESGVVYRCNTHPTSLEADERGEPVVALPTELSLKWIAIVAVIKVLALALI